MSDHMRMDTAETAHQMNLIAASGEAMATGWRTAAAHIAELAGQLGRGVLGTAFMDGYRNEAAATATAIAKCCEEPGQLAAAGSSAVTTYIAADDHSADVLNAVSSGLDEARLG